MTSPKIDLVVLAGGKGTRLKKYLGNLPKPMIKVNKKHFLTYLINYASTYNFNKIYIMCGYKASIIKKKFHKKEINFIPIECVEEKKPLGTGGCLSLIKRKLTNEFIIINGDTFLNFDYQRLIKKKIADGEILMVLKKKNKHLDNSQLSSLSIKKKKVFFSKSGNYFNAGIYKLKKKNIKNLKKKFISLENDFLTSKIKQGKILSYIHKGLFIDIGTPKSYRKSHQIIKKYFKRPAAFLDRDGTINFDYGYVHTIKKFKFRPGVIQYMRNLTKKNYYIFIVTNQAGIAKKKFKLSDFKKLHKKLKELFLINNIKIHDVAYCPYHPKALLKKFKKRTSYRKPGNLMIKKIQKNWDIYLRKSFFVGDQKKDLIAAKKSNLKFYNSKNFFN